MISVLSYENVEWIVIVLDRLRGVGYNLVKVVEGRLALYQN